MGNLGGNPLNISVNFLLFQRFSIIFIYIHEYKTLIICMPDNLIKELCLSIILVSCMLL